MTPMGGISGVKCVCNGENVYVIEVNIIIKGPHVQWVRICIYRSQYWEEHVNISFGYMNALGYLEEVLLFMKELFCKPTLLSLLELYSTFTHFLHCVQSCLLWYFKDLIHNNNFMTWVPLSLIRVRGNQNTVIIFSKKSYCNVWSENFH